MKKASTKIIHRYYYDKIYDVGIVYILNVATDKQVEAILKKNYKNTYKFYMKEKGEGANVSIEKSGGKCIQSQLRQIILVKRHSEVAVQISVLSHECLHAMINIFQTRGIEYDPRGHNEHWTYYLENLIYQALTKEKK